MKTVNWSVHSFVQRQTLKPLGFSVLLVFSSIVLLITFSLFYEIESRVVSFGEVVSSEGEVKLSAKADGEILNFELKVGQSIKKNQALLKLRIPFEDQKKITVLLNDFLAFYTKVSAEESQYIPWPNFQSENPTINLSLLGAKKVWQEYSVSLSSNHKVQHRSLDNWQKKRLSTLRKIKVLDKSKERNLMLSILDELKADLNYQELEILKIKETLKVQKNTAKSEVISEIKKSYLTILEYSESFVVRSPIDGIIARVDVNDNQQIKNGQSLISILPNPDNLSVNLQVPNTSISRVHVNANVRIEVGAYPYQRFGHFHGQVEVVDQKSEPGLSSFNVKASIKKPTDSRWPANTFQLLPGMKVKAYITTKRMTAFVWLYERVFLNESI